MVAIDESECSRYALEWVFKNLLDSIINSELVILTVQPISDYSYLAASSMGATPPELLRSFQQQQENIATALLEKAKQMCNNHGVSATTVVKVGDPKETICESVECFGATLLVLGSRGRGALKRAFLGSVSNYCVHNAKCPVLVVKKD